MCNLCPLGHRLIVHKTVPLRALFWFWCPRHNIATTNLVQAGEREKRTENKHTNGCYQTYYLLCFTVDNQPLTHAFRCAYVRIKIWISVIYSWNTVHNSTEWTVGFGELPAILSVTRLSPQPTALHYDQYDT